MRPFKVKFYQNNYKLKSLKKQLVAIILLPVNRYAEQARHTREIVSASFKTTEEILMKQKCNAFIIISL